MNICYPAETLRKSLFPTRRRESTDNVLVRYTNNEPDPRIDAHYLDAVAAGAGYLGIQFHYLIHLDGTVEIGRDPATMSSYGRRPDRPYQVVVGMVGGLDKDGKRSATKNPAQVEALEELLQGLANAYNCPLAVTDDTVPDHREQPGVNFDKALGSLFEQADRLDALDGSRKVATCPQQ